jgi:hypothetical protein
MAIIYKTLKTTSGDFSTVNAFWTWMYANYGVGTPMLDDVVLRAEPGQSFGAFGATLRTNNSDKCINFGAGKKIIFQTDETISAPNDIATVGPALILGSEQFLTTGAGVPNVEFKNLAVHAEGGGGGGWHFSLLSSDVTVAVYNSLVMDSGNTGRVYGSVNGSAGANFTMKYCCYAQWGFDVRNSLTTACAVNMYIYNNILVTFWTGVTNLSCNSTGTNLLKGNTYHNYGNSTSTLTTTGTQSGLIKGDPSFANPFITAYNEANATVQSRIPGRSPGDSLKLLITSTNVKDNADNSITLPTDYLGLPRPSGLGYDRGWFEYQDEPILCWNYRARYKDSNRMYAVRGAGKFPRELRVPSNVDISTGCMMDKGQLINPDQFKVRS